MSQIQDVAKLLKSNEQPIFYVNRPSLHLLGIEDYVANFYSIRMLDPWGSGESQESDDSWVFVPTQKVDLALSHTDSVFWLLANREVQDFIDSKTPVGMKPRIVAYLHDKRTEKLCAELGYELMAIPVDLRHKLDGKLYTTKMSEAAGLKNVPNVLAEVTGWSDLLAVTAREGLGQDLVIQSDHGEAGLGTYFVDSEDSFEKHKDQIINKKVKIMKRVNHRSLAVDAVVTREGVIVGPLLQDIIGHPEVAVNPGSSSGLEYYHDVLRPEQRQKVVDMVISYGKQLQKEGYLGLFEVDFLHDVDDGELYFGEANPRFSGCAMVTNSVTADVWSLPLYALHLYAFLDLDFEIKVSDFNDSWNHVPADLEWSNLLIRHLGRDVEKIVTAPRSGVYEVQANGSLKFLYPGTHWFKLQNKDEVFFLSYRKDGDTRVYGDDIGTMFVRGRYQDRLGGLTAEAKLLINGINEHYKTTKLSFLQRAKNSALRRLKAARG
ncbi:MAG TPA: hypothetical protein VLZ31_00600 [Microbacteriaceae bacterium]|nr:hypothetical protein [Microbacteriaceae bacterium]